MFALFSYIPRIQVSKLAFNKYLLDELIPSPSLSKCIIKEKLL